MTWSHPNHRVFPIARSGQSFEQSRVALRLPRPTGTSAELHIAEFNVDHQHVKDGLSVRAPRVGTALGRNGDSANAHMSRYQLRRWESSGDVHLVVVPAQNAALVEEKVLDAAVRLDGARESGA